MQSCDTMVSLASSSAGGQTIFGKNSDRPANECQPLIMRARQEHPPGVQAATQFLHLPQVPVTYRHVGSRPYWCWGYEHGFNEHRVVIGNEALPSRTAPATEPRLVGMELVRLGLERAASAVEAVDVMVALIEQYGQGKFENAAGVRTYDNIFLVADSGAAYVIEAAGHEWAVKRVFRTHSISNVGKLGLDAERLSLSARETAAGLGLFEEGPEQEFDFAGAFGDAAASESGIARQSRSSALLGAAEGRVDVRTMMSVLKDHSSGADPAETLVEDVAGPVCLCVHRQDAGHESASAASLVADLTADGDGRLPVYWCCLYSPCLGLYYPVFTEGVLPTVLAAGGAEPSEDSPWWAFRRLTGDGLAGGPARREEIRAAWRPLQEELLGSAYEMAATARGLIDAGRQDEAEERLTAYMADSVDRMLDRSRSLLAGAAAL